MTATIDDLCIDGFAAVRLTAPEGALAAVVVPELAMLGCSMRHRGEELLGQRGGVRSYAERGSTMGVPLLYPWANRLSDVATAGFRVEPGSDLLRIDGGTGLAIHGLRLRGAPWSVDAGVADGGAWVAGVLDLAGDPVLAAAFPRPHRLRVTYRLDDRGLAVTTVVTPSGSTSVPIAFGFHPYLALPDTPRGEWLLGADVGEHIELDGRMIPTGRRAPARGVDGALGERSFDDGYTVARPGVLSLQGPRHRVEIELVEGFPFCQIFAPADQDLIALEPMTAPTDALVSRRDLPMVAPGEEFSATFRVNVR